MACQFETLWVNPIYRRFLTLCVLFPDDPDRIDRYLIPSANNTESIAAELAEEECLVAADRWAIHPNCCEDVERRVQAD